jgi:carboxymethylenebutenolidase
MQSEWIELGDGLRGYYARPDGAGPFPCFVIFIEAYGLNDHFKRVTERFAEAGFVALTPDIYRGRVFDYTDLKGAIGHLKTLGDDVVMAQTAQAIDYLAQRPEADVSALGVTGFCMGGRFAFLANAAHASKLKAAVAFYGGGIGPVQDVIANRKLLLDRVPEMLAPIMLWYGGKDQLIRPDEHARIAEALGNAGKQYTMTVFPDATHGFFCEDRASYNADAADRSWRATLAFLREYLVGKS